MCITATVALFFVAVLLVPGLTRLVGVVVLVSLVLAASLGWAR
jgi:hypothetical protein